MSTPISPRISLFGSAVAAGLLAAGALAATPAAAQVVAYTTTSVNQRTGPDGSFPVITTVPERTRILVYGCLQPLDWCNVEYQGRGWMSAQYIQAYYQSTYYPLATVAAYLQVPTVNFNVAGGGGNGGGGNAGGGNSEGPIDVSVFYDQLAPYGHWVSYRERYVWVPGRVNRDWRPYQDGRWVYTDSNGWMWVSNEPFGWATYHYGRWAFSKTVGWFWLPDTKWAPAWVAWRSSGDYLAWAPLPPEPSSDVSITINIGQVPDYYWQVVPTRSFQSENLSQVVVRDQRQSDSFLQRTRPLGTVQVSGDQVVNTAVDVKLIEDQSQQRVVRHRVAQSQDPNASTQVSDTTVQIFTPPPTKGNGGPAKAPKVTDLKQVEQESQTKGQAGNQQATEDLVPPAQTGPAATTQPPTATTPPTNPQLPTKEGGAGAKAGGAGTNEPPPPQSTTPDTAKPPPPTDNGASGAGKPTKNSGKQQKNCPDGTTAQADGSCAAAPAGNNAPAGATQTDTPPPPPGNGGSSKEPPPPQGTAPDTGQPPPPVDNGAAGGGKPSKHLQKQQTCPDGTPAQADGSCAVAPAGNNAPAATQPIQPPPPSDKGGAKVPPPPKTVSPDNGQPPPPSDNGAASGGGKPGKHQKQQTCPDGTPAQADGSCAAAAPATPQAPADQGQTQLVPKEPPPPAADQPAAQPPATDAGKQQACPKGQALQPDGSCGGPKK